MIPWILLAFAGVGGAIYAITVADRALAHAERLNKENGDLRGALAFAERRYDACIEALEENAKVRIVRGELLDEAAKYREDHAVGHDGELDYASGLLSAADDLGQALGETQ